MIDIFFGGSALWFGIPAVIGTLFFMLRLLLMFVGGDADADVDIDFDADIDTGDSDQAFSILSVQSITAFIDGVRPRANLQRAVQEIRDSELIEESLEAGRRFAEEARAALEAFPDGEPRETLEQLVDFVVERRS